MQLNNNMDSSLPLATVNVQRLCALFANFSRNVVVHGMSRYPSGQQFDSFPWKISVITEVNLNSLVLCFC